MLHKRGACAKPEGRSEGTAIFSSSLLLLTHSIAVRHNRGCSHSIGPWVLLWLLCFLAQGYMFSFMTRNPAFIGFLFLPRSEAKRTNKSFSLLSWTPTCASAFQFVLPLSTLLPSFLPNCLPCGLQPPASSGDDLASS